MKRTATLLFAMAAGTFLMAQEVILTYENHAFVPGKHNEMKLADFVDPGPAGQDIVWDLSGMEMTREFTGTVKPSGEVSSKKSLSKADVALNEFGNKFFFKVDNRSMELQGMESVSGKSYTQYDKPMVKMVFPFKYGDHFMGDYAGTKHIVDREIALTGTYDVTADGYGKVVLPGGKEYMALRVKTIQTYTMNYSSPYNMEIVSYRWYQNSERYPLAVIQIIQSTSAKGNTSSTKRAAYKYPVLDNAEMPLADVNLYPNPVDQQLNIEYTVQDDADVYVELFDQAGRRVATLIDQEQTSGVYTFTLETGKYNLNDGTYIIRGTIGNEVVTKSFVKR